MRVSMAHRCVLVCACLNVWEPGTYCVCMSVRVCEPGTYVCACACVCVHVGVPAHMYISTVDPQ